MSNVARQQVPAVLVAAVLVLISRLLLAQPPPDPCTASAGDAADRTLQVTLKDSRSSFREGETIPLVLTFASSDAGTYSVDTRNYDHSGRLDLETFCVEPSAGRDPLADYFQAGLTGFIGGGIGGREALTASGYRLELELNEWQQLPPGRHRLRVQSRRVARVAVPNDHAGPGSAEPPLWSNAVEFQIVAADQAWQSAQLADAMVALNSGSGEEARRAARTLRFLGSEPAARELAHRFWGVIDQPFGLEFRFGLIASPHRQTSIEAMTAAMADPTHPVTREFIHTLATLEIQSDPAFRLPPYDEATKDAWNSLRDRKVEAYGNLIAGHLNSLATLVTAKTGTARAVSLNTLLSAPEATALDPAALREMLLRSWSALPVRTRNELIGYRWDDVAGPGWLPILRQIISAPPDTLSGPEVLRRDLALSRLYELSPVEARETILREIVAARTNIGIQVLGILPDRELPQVEDRLLARVQSGTAVDLHYQLLARYATGRSLPQLRQLYESSRGTWSCAPQTAMLQYFLRVDPPYGVAQVSDAMRQRDFTGCYQVLLSQLKEAVKTPAIERRAIAALEDSSPAVVRDAAGALARFGSVAAEPPLWARLETARENSRVAADEPPSRGGRQPLRPGGSESESSIANAITDALAHGQAWVLGQDGLTRLRSLVTPQRQYEVNRNLTDWQRGIFPLNLSWQVDSGFHYALATYSGDTIETLVEKLRQFPLGIRIEISLTPWISGRHRESLEVLRRAAQAAGVVLDIRIDHDRR